MNLEFLAEKNKLDMKTNFQDNEMAVTDRMKKMFNLLNERGKNYSRNKIKFECIKVSEDVGMSTPEKNKLDMKTNFQDKEMAVTDRMKKCLIF